MAADRHRAVDDTTQPPEDLAPGLLDAAIADLGIEVSDRQDQGLPVSSSMRSVTSTRCPWAMASCAFSTSFLSMNPLYEWTFSQQAPVLEETFVDFFVPQMADRAIKRYSAGSSGGYRLNIWGLPAERAAKIFRRLPYRPGRTVSPLE